MADQDLRYKNGNLLGKIKSLSNGKIELRDKNGNLKGTYDSKSNETRDKNGNLVARGDMLTTLL